LLRRREPAGRRHRPLGDAGAAHRLACLADRLLELVETGSLLGGRLGYALDAIDHELAHAAAIRSAEARHAERAHHRGTLHHPRPAEAWSMPAARGVIVIAPVAAALEAAARTTVLVVPIAGPGTAAPAGTAAVRSGLRSGRVGGWIV